MQADLIGYLLNALEEEELRRIEEMLAADKAARRQLDILRLALQPLGGSQRHDEPPQDLAARTCKFVRENRRSSK